MKKQHLSTVLFFLPFLIFCQTSTSSSGGSANGNGTVTYTIGQTLYTTNIANNGSVSQGIQQSLEIFVLSNPENKFINLNAITYPNPTKGKLVLELSSTNLSKLSYTLFDLKGRLLLRGNIKGKNTIIDIEKYASGVYLLKIDHQNKEMKTFKVIKK